jgi:cell wall-associated NlpC family hydrolase
MTSWVRDYISGAVSMTSWVRDYIGLPFQAHGRDRAGVDCYGLYRLVLSEQLGIHLPEYLSYDSITDRAGIAATVADAQEALWQEVTTAPRLYDLVLLRLYGLPLHVGLYLGDARMLHIEERICAAVERLDGPVWGRRVLGYWRPTGLEV